MKYFVIVLLSNFALYLLLNLLVKVVADIISELFPSVLARYDFIKLDKLFYTSFPDGFNLTG